MQTEVVILGAAGFGGGELLRLLAAHPAVAAIHAVSASHAGRPVTSAHPHLHSLASLQFSGSIDWPSLDHAGQLVVFSAMPHGRLAQQFRELKTQLEAHGGARPALLVDLSGDFRLTDPAAFAAAYGVAHPCPEFLGTFTYGMPELNKERIAEAHWIANPGCFATALNLALLPLCGLSGLGLLAISGVTGSSGSGTLAGPGTHHPTRAQDFRAYKVLTHRHQAEAEMLLHNAGGAGWHLSFVPHSAPLVRGIFATVQLMQPPGLTAEALATRLHAAYDAEPFVHIMPGSPHIATTAGTNHAEISITAAGASIAVMCALDNLGKGMAGQAVQNMNIALGLDETCGLQQDAIFP